MTQIVAASPTPSADAIIAISRIDPTAPRTGPLRSGNPRGNPNLAPRCGAKARTTGLACRAPAMANGRCRMHGGKSTGPRTPEGLARLARAHTTHGWCAQAGPEADLRRELRHARVAARRARLNGAAYDHLPWLPPGMAARLRADTVTELQAPKYCAQFRDAPTAATPEPTGEPPAACEPPPPGHSPHLRRDARGRFALAPPRMPRGRQAERAQARAEAAALAPWKLAIARARTARRQTMHPEQTAESEILGINPMTPRHEQFGQDHTRHLPPGACPGGGTVAHPTGPAGVDDAGRAETSIHRGTVAQPIGAAGADDAGCAETSIQRGTVTHPTGPAGADDSGRAETSIQRGTVAHPTGAAGADDAGCAETSIHRGTVAHPTGAAGADGAGRAETSIQRGTVRPTEGAFRRALLGSAVCNTPDTHRLAAKVERAGGWPILLAVDAAKRAGQDWRPAVAEARRRLADDADRLRGRHGPPCGPSLRLAPVADLVRTPGLGGDP
jgi:hypothetical protein